MGDSDVIEGLRYLALHRSIPILFAVNTIEY
jgi:hypothetical protein